MTELTTAQQLFLAYGVLVLSYGFLLGIPMAAVRRGAPAAPRSLVTTHLSALMQAPIHLGLAALVALIGVDSGWATAAAVLVVAGSLLEICGGTVNWLQQTGDQFAEQSTGFKLNALTGPTLIPGGVILVVLTLTNL